MNKPNLFKQSLSEKQFLEEYWHKLPLLLTNAIALPDLDCLPNKQQLIQLSCEEDIQSRVVIKNDENDYDVELGPFEAEDFDNLNDFCWNLLVSDIDKWQPKSRNILKYFNFIRNWVFDDIMISTGSTGGTVGPHTDHYDVFLIQVHGQRQWQYSLDKIYDPELMPEQHLKLMNNFKADKTFTLNPGDVLYLPPEVAHYGIAKSDDCVTCSVGIRTPSHSELLTSFVDNIAQKISANHRFEEPEFDSQPELGEITDKDLEAIKAILVENLTTQNIKQWFGKYITEYRSIFHEFNRYHEKPELDLNKTLELNPFSKASYYSKDDNTLLFINGNEFNSSLKLAQLICNTKKILPKEITELDQTDREILQTLLQNKSLTVLE